MTTKVHRGKAKDAPRDLAALESKLFDAVQRASSDHDAVAAFDSATGDLPVIELVAKDSGVALRRVVLSTHAVQSARRFNAGFNDPVGSFVGKGVEQIDTVRGSYRVEPDTGIILHELKASNQ
jgi:hypothetical protein